MIGLSEYYVDYPNYIPIYNRSLTYYVYAIRMSHYAQPGSTDIYFDDVSAGIEKSDGYEIILPEGFELQSEIPDCELPCKSPIG